MDKTQTSVKANVADTHHFTLRLSWTIILSDQAGFMRAEHFERHFGKNQVKTCNDEAWKESNPNTHTQLCDGQKKRTKKENPFKADTITIKPCCKNLNKR